MRLGAGWEQTESKIEQNRSTREAQWKDNGSKMEVEWKQNGSRIEAERNQNGSRMKEHTFFDFKFVIKYYWIP